VYKSLDDLPKRLIEKIEHHFNHYKDLYKPGSTKVKSFDGLDEAKKVIADAIKRWQ
jgi:inorganic pyrophosphatase